MKTIMDITLSVPGINFIFLCHERDGKQSFKKEPDYFNAASQEFMRPLSCLYRLTTTIQDGVVVRTFQTQGTDQVTAKNRITGLPPALSGNAAITQIATAYLNWSKAEKEKQEKAPVESPTKPEPVAPITAPEPEVSVSSPDTTDTEDSPQAVPESSKQSPEKIEADDLRALLGI